MRSRGVRESHFHESVLRCAHALTLCVAAGRWYYGKVTAYNDATGEHEVTYDDLEVKNYLLTSRVFFLLKDTARPGPAGGGGSPPASWDVLPMTVRLPSLVGFCPYL